MSVTALATHTLRSGRWSEGHAAAQPHRQQPTGTPAPPGRSLTIHIELTVRGGTGGTDVRQAVDALRDAVIRLGGSSVTVAPSAELAVTPTAEPAVTPTAELAGTDQRLRILADERSVWVGAAEVALSRLEYDLLLFLAERPRRAFTRAQLLESVWGYSHASGRTIDVHVRRLRAKLGAAGPLLTTIRGIGYRLDPGSRIAVVRQPVGAQVGRG